MNYRDIREFTNGHTNYEVENQDEISNKIIFVKYQKVFCKAKLVENKLYSKNRYINGEAEIWY